MTVEEVAEAIRNLVVRGAPYRGGSRLWCGSGRSELSGHQEELAEYLESLELLSGTRPTAVNLSGPEADAAGLAEIRHCCRTSWQRSCCKRPGYFTEDVAANQAIGRYGADLSRTRFVFSLSVMPVLWPLVVMALPWGVVRSCFEQGKLMTYMPVKPGHCREPWLTAWDYIRIPSRLP